MNENIKIKKAFMIEGLITVKDFLPFSNFF